ncbi:hypothetical protein JZ751_008639 [Albula glossodonta]|uniref:Uncharacterized protein n=1 Tax=Albula glossodonta TaxID=121402 RepID=A0A8T2NYR4_9TELE|nr:hypothetical protein JZ751_008639 [Albula glossodonta]
MSPALETAGALGPSGIQLPLPSATPLCPSPLQNCHGAPWVGKALWEEEQPHRASPVTNREEQREASVAEDQLSLLLEKAQKELVLVKQGLDEALTRERSAMHCGLVKKRRGLISDKEHKQKQKELSAVSRTCEESLDPAHYLTCWQNLLMAQCLELGELINNLDEEAAADIRKVTMRAIHSAVVEAKAIQPSTAQALLGLGAPPFLLQQELVGAALSEAQERLHQEGKAAVRTLQRTRDTLQDCMELELQEQQALRQRGRTFFQ